MLRRILVEFEFLFWPVFDCLFWPARRRQVTSGALSLMNPPSQDYLTIGLNNVFNLAEVDLKKRYLQDLIRNNVHALVSYYDATFKSFLPILFPFAIDGLSASSKKTQMIINIKQKIENQSPIVKLRNISPRVKRSSNQDH